MTLLLENVPVLWWFQKNKLLDHKKSPRIGHFIQFHDLMMSPVPFPPFLKTNAFEKRWIIPAIGQFASSPDSLINVFHFVTSLHRIETCRRQMIPFDPSDSEIHTQNMSSFVVVCLPSVALASGPCKVSVDKDLRRNAFYFTISSWLKTRFFFLNYTVVKRIW